MTDIDPLPGNPDPVAGRGAAQFSLGHRVLRLVWGVVWRLFAAWTPPPFNRWRLFILRLFGAKIHPTALVRGPARIWYPPNLTMQAYSTIGAEAEIYNMAPVVIGENSIVSQRAYLCGGTHDFTRASNPLITRPITIGPSVWVAADAFIGPGVTVPEGCVIGARAVVTGRLEPWTVYAGNPARAIKRRDYDPQS